MNPYNGFTPWQRTKALNWSNAEKAAGRRPAKPSACECCGQKKGVLDFHSEDYSEPFGPHISQYQLCFRCHMVLHCRQNNPAAFKFYREAIYAGCQWPGVPARDFEFIKRDHLRSPYSAPGPTQPPGNTKLDQIIAHGTGIVAGTIPKQGEIIAKKRQTLPLF